MGGGPARRVEQAVRRFDDFQAGRWWLAFPVAIVRKYADDRGSALAALITFQVFVGLLPLLVVVLTILGVMLEGSADLREATLDSTLGQLPVVGDRIRSDLSALSASGLVLLISIIGLLWTSLGIYQSLQLAMNQVWNVPGVHRQGFVSRHARAALLFVLLIVGAAGTAWVPWTTLVGWFPDVMAAILFAIAGLLATMAVLLLVLRIVVSPAVPAQRLMPAAVFGGLLWDLLQRVGASIVVDRLTRADDLYGTLGLVVVTLFWINLLARAVIFASEWAVVGGRRLWPRRVAQPPLTDADERVLTALVRNERRRPEQHIVVKFEESDP